MVSISLSLFLFFFSCLSSDLTSSVSKVAQKQPKMQETTCNEGDLGLKLLKAPRAGEIGKKKKISVGPMGSREWKAWALRNQSLELSGVS